MANTISGKAFVEPRVSVARAGEICYIDGEYTWCNGNCCDGEGGCCVERKTSVRERVLKTQLEQRRARAANMEETNNGLTAKVSKVITELENTKIFVQNLTEMIRQLEKKNTNLTETVAYLKEEKAALDTVVVHLRVQNTELTETNDNLEIENKRLSDQLREIKQVLMDTNKKIQELSPTDISG